MMQLVLTKIGSDRPLLPKEKQNLTLPARMLRSLPARRPDSARLLGAGLCVDGTVTSKMRGEGGSGTPAALYVVSLRSHF